MPESTTALRGCHLDAIRRRTLDARDGVYQTPADADREALLAEVDRLAGLSNARAIEGGTTPPDDTTAPVTAEGLPVRIVRWITDGKPNIHVGDKILDEGEMCTVEAVYVETLISDGSPWMHVSLRDPRAANTGLPVHAAEFSGMSLVAVRPAAGDPGDPLERMAEVLYASTGMSVPWSMVKTDPELSMVAKKYREFATALSVRWEHAAHIAARLADAERRAEHAEGEHQVTQDRLVESERIRTKLKQTIDAFPDARDAANLAHARAERDRLRARLTGVAIHANRVRNCIWPDTPAGAALADLFAALEETNDG